MNRAGRHILMTTDAVGGVWVYATQLARALTEHGHRVTLITQGPAPRQSQLDEIADARAGIELIVTDLALEWMDPAGDDAGRARETLLRIADRASPNLIHLNSYREAAFAWPAPVMAVAHSCVLSWWQACRGGLPEERRWQLYRANLQAGLAAADLWVAPTSAFRATIRQFYAPPTPGVVTHNGTDVPCRQPCAKYQVILTSGRLWDEAKNLAALAAIAPELAWPVEVAGPVSAPETGANTIAPGNWTWLGELPRPALLERMRQSAIYVAPARYEPFGLGILEAAAAGCALVLSDIPSLRELWNGAAAFVDPNDSAALREALTRLCADGQRRRELQHAAIVRAGAYTIAGSAARYCALYDDLLGSTAPRRREELLA